MSPQIVVVEGTLKTDGTLELDQKPGLSPGRVRVTLQPAHTGTTPKRRLADVFDEIQRGQQARGYTGRSLEEMKAEQAERKAEEEDYEKRCAQLIGLETTRNIAK